MSHVTVRSFKRHRWVVFSIFCVCCLCFLYGVNKTTDVRLFVRSFCLVDLWQNHQGEGKVSRIVECGFSDRSFTINTAV